jgi:hypothetical protein
MPKLIQQGMNADTDAVIDVFGKNEQVRKVFWTLFIMMAGLVQARLWTRGYPAIRWRAGQWTNTIPEHWTLPMGNRS